MLHSCLGCCELYMWGSPLVHTARMLGWIYREDETLAPCDCAQVLAYVELPPDEHAFKRVSVEPLPIQICMESVVDAMHPQPSMLAAGRTPAVWQ